jgi:Arc/MetJ family transcription regulator
MFQMRTNIEIDNELMTEAMELSGLPTKKAVVEEALKMLIEGHGAMAAIRDMAGLGWEGDLDEIRGKRR